eukprot:jgi/Phyca11/131273/e_gw1.103.112.1
MRNWYDSFKLARSGITKPSSMTGAPTASTCSASDLMLLICSNTSLPSTIIVVKKRRRRKSMFARLFFSKCPSKLDHASYASFADRTNGNCESSIASQMIANALRDFLLNVVWSSVVV